MTPRAIIRLFGFQLVWLACAVGAARGHSWPGILAAVLLLGFHFAVAIHRHRAVRHVLAAGAFGLVAENLLVSAGLIQYMAQGPIAGMAPAWIITLWLAFAVTVDPVRALLGPHPLVKAALLGSMVGPLSYLAGERLGALAFPKPAWPSLAAIAVIWGFALPALLAMHVRDDELRDS